MLNDGKDTNVDDRTKKEEDARVRVDGSGSGMFFTDLLHTRPLR